jgi:hypothetical protein
VEKLSETRILKYKYDSEEEREQHVKYMEYLDYECTGQVRKSDDSLMSDNRKYYWYGEFVQQF